MTSVSCALTHPGWNNDIPHHVIQPPRYSLPRHPDPSAPHIPGHSGERGNLPSYGPGAPVSGLAAAKERGYGLCLKEYMSYVKDTLSESPQPALPLACISNARSPTARAKTGRRRRELHRAANASLDQRTAGLSPLSSISGTGICPTCLPGSPGLDLVLLGAGGGKKPPRRAAVPLSGWETSKARPFPPKPNTATALKAEADGFAARFAHTGAQAVAPLHLQMISVTLYWSPLMHGTNYLFGEAILIKLLSTEFKSLKQEKQKPRRLKRTHTPQT